MRKIKNLLAIFFLTLFFILLFYNVLFGFKDQFNSYFLSNKNINKSSNKIVIIKIDTETIERLQKINGSYLAFSKSMYNKIIEELIRLDASVIGFDIIFANQNSSSQDFAQMIEKYQNKIVIGAKVGSNGQEKVLPLGNFPKGSIGGIDLISESGIVMKYLPFSKEEDIESFGILIYKKFIGDNSKGILDENFYQIDISKKIPLDEKNEAYINFFNLPGGFKNFSLIDLIEGKIQKKDIEGKIVLIGEGGSMIHDSYLSGIDFENKMPGVEFHANIVESILNNKFLQKQNFEFYIFSIGISTLVLILIFYFSSLKLSIFILFLYFYITFIFGRYLFSIGIIIDVFTYDLVGIFAFLTTFSYRYVLTDKDRKKIENAFSKYISSDLVKKISSNEKNIILGGEKRNLAIIFSDIEGFTSICEKLETEKLFAFLSEYLFEMTNILMKNNGTLDKYIGDAIMGFYGAPIEIEKPVFFACKTALEMQRKLETLNQKWQKEGIPKIIIRIGIDYGEVMVGNIGSDLRFNYTVIGDRVNLASRLEGVNKEYSTSICISEDVYNLVKKDFLFRQIDKIKVKGKNNPVVIYEIIGFYGENIDLEIYKNYEWALDFYYQGEFKTAKEKFDKNFKDNLSRIMSKRCEDLIAGKIKLQDSVFELQNK